MNVFLRQIVSFGCVLLLLGSAMSVHAAFQGPGSNWLPAPEGSDIGCGLNTPPNCPGANRCTYKYCSGIMVPGECGCIVPA